jgi:hypothetical protein
MILTLMDSVSAVGFHFGKSSKIPRVRLRRRQEDFSQKGAEMVLLLPAITMLGWEEQLMCQPYQAVMTAIYRTS